MKDPDCQIQPQNCRLCSVNITLCKSVFTKRRMQSLPDLGTQYGVIIYTVVSALLISLIGANDESYTVLGNSCGEWLSLRVASIDVHWKGAALPDDCTLYISNDYRYKNTLCAHAVLYDVEDQHFKLTFQGGLLDRYVKVFTASDNVLNVSYCAQESSALTLTFFTYTRTKSHIHIVVTQTPFKPDFYKHSESLPPVVYRLLGGVGVIIMVGLLASVVIKRRRARMLSGGLRNGHLRSSGLILRRPGQTDSRTDEALVALYRPSQRNPVTFPETATYNMYEGNVSSPPTYPHLQPVRPPDYSDTMDNQSEFKQYPDTAPPSYDDVTSSRSENTKT